MEQNFITALDEYFCAQYSDYVKINAIAGYHMPEMVSVGRDGNIFRHNSEKMRLSHQSNAKELLAVFKSNLVDTNFTFSFSFRKFGDKIRDPFRKYTFAKYLPIALKACGESAESAGEKLDIDKKFWKKIVKGKLYPEKNTVLALALTCGMRMKETVNLLAVCGFSFEQDNVRDVVVEYLIKQQIFNEQMRDACLKEYAITNLPIKKA